MDFFGNKLYKAVKSAVMNLQDPHVYAVLRPFSQNPIFYEKNSPSNIKTFHMESTENTMENCIDIHSHILPGVDDGSDCLESSLQMLRIAALDQISHIILTPHNKPAHRNVSPRRIVERMEELQGKLNEGGMDIVLYAGNELYYRGGLVQELDDGEAMTLAGSHYVLVEFSPSAEYGYIRNGIYSLQMGGYRPILAHVERYRDVCVKPDRIGELAAMGCYIQVNAGSIMGRYGYGTRKLAGRLLKKGLVHFVATDAHDTGKRSPKIADCAAYIAGRYGEGYAKELLWDNPLRVLHDGYIAE